MSSGRLWNRLPAPILAGGSRAVGGRLESNVYPELMFVIAVKRLIKHVVILKPLEKDTHEEYTQIWHCWTKLQLAHKQLQEHLKKPQKNLWWSSFDDLPEFEDCTQSFLILQEKNISML